MKIKRYNDFLNESLALTNGSIKLQVIVDDDTIDDWKSDKQIKTWEKEGRVQLNTLTYDEYEVYAIEGDNEVIDYVEKTYGW